MRFTKMHGLGNDYIVVEWMELAREIGRKNSEILVCKFPEKHPEAEQALGEWIQHACDRHFGIGADGVLIICPSQTADFRMLIYNADGSRAKMCGNGIRCVAKYVYDYGLTDRTDITVETDSGIKTLHLTVENQKVKLVEVDMGAPILIPEEIPVDAGAIKAAGDGHFAHLLRHGGNLPAVSGQKLRPCQIAVGG